jgi:hypothetical protein
MEMGSKKYSSLSYRFGTNDRHVVKEIFVEESLLQIEGQNYWLWWISYEANLNVSLMMQHLSRERRTIFFICYDFFFKQLCNRYGKSLFPLR